jgi:hypothetical protein
MVPVFNYSNSRYGKANISNNFNADIGLILERSHPQREPASNFRPPQKTGLAFATPSSETPRSPSGD